MSYLDNNDQNNRELNDWRNITLNQPAPTYEPLWMPTTVNQWNTPVALTYPWTNTMAHPPWFSRPYPAMNPLLNIDMPIGPAQPDVIDLTVNTPVPPDTGSFNFPIETGVADPDPIEIPNLVPEPEPDIEEILGQVEAVIPDIDLDAARRTISTMKPIPSSNDIVTHFLDNGYTKRSKKILSDDFQRQSSSSLKRSWLETMDDIPQFLTSYSDPTSFFMNNQRKQSESYINHAKAFLVRAFPSIDKTILEQALEEENFHFLPTVRKLETRMGLRTNTFLQRSTIRKSLDMLELSNGGTVRMPSMAWHIKNNKFAYAIPHTPCEEFYDELRYAKNEVKIRRYLGKVSKEHEKRVKKAKKGNETLECEICFQDDLLIDDMVECTVGHLYCRSCIRNHVNVCFNEGKCRFLCAQGSCPGEYTMSLISELLPPKDFRRLGRRVQEENIRQAEIAGLECCPYCPYAVIVDNPNDKVFRCLNPECMKETCRLCKEPNHIPLRCDEIEKGIELEMRKFIEEHVTEAMIRKCPRCTQKFYKVEGCNKMTCSSCGLFICYVCRETITGYDHFTNNEKCTLSNQSEKIHYDEMVQAYANAKAEYLRRHPEAHDMILRYDPISHLSKPPSTK